MTSPPSAQAPLIVFDGLCKFCDGGMQWVLKQDRKRVFMFAAAQSAGARARLGAAGVELKGDTPGTIVVIDGSRVWTHSEAVIEIASRLGVPWSVARLARVVPRALRDPVYRAFAKRRTQWFGRLQTCRVPTPEQRARFLD